jgi:hypothetical protein
MQTNAFADSERRSASAGQYCPYAMALYLALSIAGCGSAPPKTNLAHDLYPTALLAEPIKLRAGYEHVTQPFEVEGPEQSWSIELGLERHDDPNQANGTSATTREFFCNATSRKDMLRDVRKCSDTEPGIHLRWELFTIDGKIVRSATYDALLEKAGHTSTIYAVTVGLKGFTSLPKGTYRLKVVVLRDFLQLDANSPQILVSPPFFRKH